MIFGNTSDPIELTCTASVGFTITSTEYNFTWWKNGQLINLTDDRIMVCTVLHCYLLHNIVIIGYRWDDVISI